VLAVLPELCGAGELRQPVFQDIPVALGQQVQQLLHPQERAGHHADELGLSLLPWDTSGGVGWEKGERMMTS